MDLVQVKMRQHYRGLNPSEIAGFPKRVADRLVQDGAAMYWPPMDVQESPGFEPTPSPVLPVEQSPEPAVTKPTWKFWKKGLRNSTPDRAMTALDLVREEQERKG